MTHRYGVRLAGHTGQDQEIVIEATSPGLAAAAFADTISEEDGHHARTVEVWVNGAWKKQEAAPYTVTRYATEEVV